MKLKRKQKSKSREINILFSQLETVTPLDQSMLHEWAKELTRTSVHSYSESMSLISTLWFMPGERLLIESVLYGRIE
jgi:hypothetical protein